MALVQLVQYGAARMPYILERVFTFLERVPDLITFVLDRAMILGHWLFNVLPGLLSAAFQKAGEFMTLIGNALNAAGWYLQGPFQQDVANAIDWVFKLGDSFLQMAQMVHMSLIGLAKAFLLMMKPILMQENLLARAGGWAMEKIAERAQRKYEETGDEAWAKRAEDAWKAREGLRAMENAAWSVGTKGMDVLDKLSDTSMYDWAREKLKGSQQSVTRSLQSAGSTVGGWLQGAAPWVYSGAQVAYGMAEGFSPNATMQYQPGAMYMPSQLGSDRGPGYNGWSPAMAPAAVGGTTEKLMARGYLTHPLQYDSKLAVNSPRGRGTTLVFHIGGADKQTIMDHVGTALDRWQMQNRRNRVR